MSAATRWCAALLAVALAASAAPVASAESHHEGYYYPAPQTREIYRSRTDTLPDSNRKRRVLFVTELTNQMMSSPYPPQFALLAKGEQAQKMIITSLYAGAFDTLYRLRGLLAMLSARARATPLFRDSRFEEMLTFFDLLKLLGFEQLTVTDGDRVAHQVVIE